jgi:C4-dicarboxylate transporter DctM subunit
MSLAEVVQAAVPWLMLLLGFLIVITYIPPISVFLPNLMFGPEIVNP